MLTRDQKYAMDAHDKVRQIQKHPKAKSYGVMAHKLPMLIRSAGLAQALAFVESRGNECQRELLDDLASTIGKADRQELLKASRGEENTTNNEGQLQAYMRLTQQIMDALLWYKRFAQSILDVQSGDSAEDEEGRTQ
jgi:CRISPR-associated protein Cmr5